MEKRMIVCKCGKVKTSHGWEYPLTTITTLVRELCRTDEPNVILTLLITKCDKCLII